MAITQTKITDMARLLFFSFFLFPLLASAQLQSPNEFLPHQLGETFTPHHMLVDYFQHVAAQSDRVQLMEYGRTNEDRPLLLAFVSTPENLARLDAIRQNNLKRTGLVEGDIQAELDRAIVWLSFSVHGNEAAGSEASMGVVHDLVTESRTANWLQNTIVIIDPSVNPDGYSRYSHWYRGVANRLPNPSPEVREHREPWPGGRVNHYLFDLNRDWAWQTQVESRQRAVQYLQWMPHIHADLHEQFYNNPYYFAPAARPYHRYITDFQGDFQYDIGRNHARYFDDKGWLYFTREVFDLFYPSYGDTYPTFNGAIGMTYEQGGHSRGGRAIELPNQDTLTLFDRVAHHRTTALSTVEIASRESDRLLREFGNYFQRAAVSPTGKYRTYIIDGDAPRGRLRAMLDLLDRNGIQYGRAQAGSNIKGFNYQNGKDESWELKENDLVISAFQPRSVMTQVLFDPTADLEDSLTYDITAWSLPYAYGLSAYASTQRLEVSSAYELPAYESNIETNQRPYAYLVDWSSTADAHFLSQLLQHDIQVRYASTGFRQNGTDFPAGTLVITRADNRKMTDFDAKIRALAREYEPGITAIQSGFSSNGPDIGSAAMELIKRPRVATFAGEQTFANEFGQVWYFFEQNLEYPIDILYIDDLGQDMGDYDVIILPEGYYNINEKTAEELGSWVRNGGRLIAIGRANRMLAGKNGFALKNREGNEQNTSANTAPEDDPRLADYGGRERRNISESNPGAIVKVRMDASHPLAFGLSDTYFSLKTNTSGYPYLENGWNVGTLGEDLQVSGFIGAKAQAGLKESVIVGVQQKGGGSIVYLIDNPLYRGFWENGKLLMSNAIFLR